MLDNVPSNVLWLPKWSLNGDKETKNCGSVTDRPTGPAVKKNQLASGNMALSRVCTIASSEIDEKCTSSWQVFFYILSGVYFILFHIYSRMRHCLTNYVRKMKYTPRYRKYCTFINPLFTVFSNSYEFDRAISPYKYMVYYVFRYVGPTMHSEDVNYVSYWSFCFTSNHLLPVCFG
jgi:hypothetical protein